MLIYVAVRLCAWVEGEGVGRRPECGGQVAVCEVGRAGRLGPARRGGGGGVVVAAWRWRGGPGDAYHPVMDTSWCAARAAAAWLGCGLCTDVHLPFPCYGPFFPPSMGRPCASHFQSPSDEPHEMIINLATARMSARFYTLTKKRRPLSFRGVAIGSGP